MVITFVSNYINHHQIPFCNAMEKVAGKGSFTFIQTSPMEKERIEMGWAVDPKAYSYVELFYEDREKCEKLISDSDVVIFGWSDELIENLEKKRLSSGKNLQGGSVEGSKPQRPYKKVSSTLCLQA